MWRAQGQDAQKMNQNTPEVFEISSDDDAPITGRSRPSERHKPIDYLSISDDGLEITNVQAKPKQSLSHRVRQESKRQNNSEVNGAQLVQNQVPRPSSKPRQKSSPHKNTSPRKPTQRITFQHGVRRPVTERDTKASNADRLEDHIRAVAEAARSQDRHQKADHEESRKELASFLSAIDAPGTDLGGPVIKKLKEHGRDPQATTDTLESVQTSEAHGSRRCTTCIEDNQVCDGRQPCNRCTAPGLDCVYNDELLPASQHGISRSTPKRHRKQKNIARDVESTVENIANVPISVNVENLPEKDTSERDTRTTYPIPRKLSTIGLGQLEHMPRNDSLPDSLDEVRQIIRTHRDNLNAHREYLLEAQLVQARVRSQQKPTLPSQGAKVNPFKKFLQEKESHNQEPPLTSSTKLQIKVHGQHRGPRKNNYQTVVLPVRPLPIDPKAVILPKYQSIGRLGTSFLSKNVHTLLSLPYFADNEGPDDSAAAEREAELKERYRNNDIGMHENPFRELRQQRRCLERIWHWSADFADLLEELQLTPEHLRDWLQRSHALSKNVHKCKTCELTCDWLPKHVPRVEDALPFRGTPEEARRCKWLHETFTEITSIPVWHFLNNTHGGEPEKKKKRELPEARADPHNDPEPLLCSICFAHNCLVHGSYLDGDMDRNERGPTINDPELENNTRVTAVIGPNKKLNDHICGLFCCSTRQFSTPISQIVGLDATGKLTGQYNETTNMVQGLAGFKGTVLCSGECFLDIAQRNALAAAWRPDETTDRLARSMLRMYGNNLRLPCMVAKIAKVSCVNALRQIIRVHQEPPHSKPHDLLDEGLPNLEDVDGRKLANRPAGYVTENSADLDKRRPFVPCSHPGPCLKENGCRCAQDKVHCEHFCNCDQKCRRRFKGCRCRGTCFKDIRCDCWANNRECDPWLCKTCGVLEVLDPPNKYRDEIRIGRCKNNAIQLDLPAKTTKAPSEVQGWGLFAGQDLEQYAFIGEYKGEIISSGPMEESDRRGVVYHNHGLEYLFKMNKEQEIDGSTFGNKTRFMNNSQLDKHINVSAQKLLANGMARIMFFTKRPVKAGEELLYNYNYPEDVYKHFWEKGDRVEAGTNGVITAMAKPNFGVKNARLSAGAALAKTDGEQGPARKRVEAAVVRRQTETTTRRQKRKRKVVDEGDEEKEEEEDYDEEAAVGQESELIDYDEGDPAAAEQLLNDFQRKPKGSPSLGSSPPHQAESSDEEYEEEGDESHEESGPEVGGTDSEEEVPARRRRSRGQGFDSRFGGEAQRKAAATRRERASRGGRY